MVKEVELRIEHVLLFVVAAFLLYHLSRCGSIRNGFRVGGQGSLLTLDYIETQNYDYGVNACPQTPMDVYGIGKRDDDPCSTTKKKDGETLNSCDTCVNNLNRYFNLCPPDITDNKNMYIQFKNADYGIPHYCPGKSLTRPDNYR